MSVFFCERYHRAFDEECAFIASLLPFAREVPLDGARSSFGTLLHKLAAHAAFQEQLAFPAHAREGRCPQRLFDQFVMDAAALCDAARALGAVCERVPKRSALVVRMLHLSGEVERHVVEELAAFLPSG